MKRGRKEGGERGKERMLSPVDEDDSRIDLLTNTFVCLSVCLFVYLFVCLFVCLSVCLSVCLGAGGKQ